MSQRAESIATKDSNSISLGLLGMALKASVDLNITHWLVCMEPALARLLARHGMHFAPAGPILDYHGKRQPMVARVGDLLSGVHSTRKDFFYLNRHFQNTVEDLQKPQIRSQDDQDPFRQTPHARSPGRRTSRNTNLTLVQARTLGAGTPSSRTCRTETFSRRRE